MKNQHFQWILRFNLLILALTFASCQLKPAFDIQGHRGCRGLYPENSIPAFKNAIELGVTTLELDVVITKDKQVVVSHEPYVNSLICLDFDNEEIPDSMGRRINLYKLNFDELKQYDCGSKTHPYFPNQKKLAVHKPLLSEVFDLADSLNSNVRFNIEIKARPEYDNEYTPEPKEFVSLVLKTIKSSEMLQRSTLQSFDLRVLEEIRIQNEDIPIAILVDEDESIDNKLSQLSYKPEILSPYYKLLNETIVKENKLDGYRVIPWTVNDMSDLEMVLKWKVDGIITDYPDRLLKIISP